MTDKLTAATLQEISLLDLPVCLSLYQPTHRKSPDNQQDPIRFRNLVKSLETSLREEHSAAETKALLEPFVALAQDQNFWNHALDGLAVLGGPSYFRVFRLQRSAPELAIVAGTFHSKPLRHYLQSAERFQVLGLSRGGLRFFEGNRDTLDEITPETGVPQTMSAALGDELTEPRHTVASYGGVGGSQGAMHHGHGGKKDEVDHDAERFFRAVDRAVLEHHSRPSELPLILVALPEHHAIFRKVSHNPLLMEEGLTVNPESLSLDELRERVWKLVEPQHQARQVAMAEAYTDAMSVGLGSYDLAQVAEAAASGRVATLLIESGRQIPGRLDFTTGAIDIADLSSPQVDDMLDDLGQLVGKMGGEVWVMRADLMPTTSGLAATYRH
ncbi:MAG: hypothetical protein Q8L60_15665 [Gammaproteobacteria bacterium]|nr:hypothetical protein [Gammaproteobacteria bacterium]MDP2139521.1 hypothetical protein [Gammaproteobacteria bacterium]MDP2346494.1 hypothetical protein [Gammaproteobacteria bacterium]